MKAGNDCGPVKTIGAFTIGQTPRDDIIPELKSSLGRGYRIIEAGALDGIKEDEIVNQPKRFAESRLVTRLYNGAEIRVSKRFVVDRLQQCFQNAKEPCDLIILLCTGDPPAMRSSCPILYPGKVLKNVVFTSVRVWGNSRRCAVWMVKCHMC